MGNAPKFVLPTTVSPIYATKEALEDGINGISSSLYNLQVAETLARISGDDSHSEGLYYAGSWDASTGAFPTTRTQGGVIQNGDVFTVGVAGVVDGVTFALDERITSLVDLPSSTTYAGNWYQSSTIANLAPLTGRVDYLEDSVFHYRDTSLAISDTTPLLVNSLVTISGGLYQVVTTGGDVVGVANQFADLSKRTRAGLMAAIATDGYLWVADGLTYIKDTSATGVSSATNDLLVNGWRPFGEFSVSHFGDFTGPAAFEACIAYANANGSTGSSGREDTGFVFNIPEGVIDLTAGLTGSVDVDNVKWRGAGAEQTKIKITSGSVFKFGAGLVSGRAHSPSVEAMMFFGVSCDTSSLMFDMHKTVMSKFTDIVLRDVGKVARLGQSGSITSSAHFSNVRGWTANLGVATFDLVEGAGFTLDESCYIYTNIGTPSQVDGTHDGAANAATLADTTATFVAGELVGGIVRNITDGSIGTITANTATTVTATLSGGTDNDWDVSDVYQVQEPHEALPNQHFINCEGNWDTVQAIGARCNRYYRSINCAPPSGNNANNWFLTNFVGDYTAHGMRWDSTGGNIRNHLIDGGWSFALMGNSVTLEGSGIGLLDHVHFSNVQAMLSGANGFDISKGDYCSVKACTTQGQGRMTNTSAGVKVSGIAKNIVVEGGTHGLDASTTTPYDAQAAYGVQTTVDTKRLTLSDIRASGTVSDFDIATPLTQAKASTIRGNYNTSGGDADYMVSFGGLITVPASTVDYTNTTPFEIRYYVTAGAVTNVKKNGIRISNTSNCSVNLRAGETLNITYTAVPTVLSEVVN